MSWYYADSEARFSSVIVRPFPPSSSAQSTLINLLVPHSRSNLLGVLCFSGARQAQLGLPPSDGGRGRTRASTTLAQRACGGPRPPIPKRWPAFSY